MVQGAWSCSTSAGLRVVVLAPVARSASARRREPLVRLSTSALRTAVGDHRGPRPRAPACTGAGAWRRTVAPRPAPSIHWGRHVGGPACSSSWAWPCRSAWAAGLAGLRAQAAWSGAAVVGGVGARPADRPRLLSRDWPGGLGLGGQGGWARYGHWGRWGRRGRGAAPPREAARQEQEIGVAANRKRRANLGHRRPHSMVRGHVSYAGFTRELRTPNGELPQNWAFQGRPLQGRVEARRRHGLGTRSTRVADIALGPGGRCSRRPEGELVLLQPE